MSSWAASSWRWPAARCSAAIDRVLGNALAGTSCFVLSSDVRVGHAKTAFRVYPDASIVCGEVEYATRPPHTVTNPVCIIEVLSESTANYDQGDKLAGYKRIPS